ncbi:MAG: DUF896 domain-containing protein [Oscillospiraceae bacterium]|nr:DUF896 domain-containing protein [Oscillospiraceae bacterium]
MERKKLDRINELARKKKNGEPLTEEETAEQAALRREYVEEFRRGTIATLENTYLQRPDGTKEKLRRRD